VADQKVTCHVYLPQGVSQEAMCEHPSPGASGSWEAVLGIGQQGSIPFSAIVFPIISYLMFLSILGTGLG
jgi:hypothetical protein